jgi:hypothetical protein
MPVKLIGFAGAKSRFHSLQNKLSALNIMPKIMYRARGSIQNDSCVSICGPDKVITVGAGRLNSAGLEKMRAAMRLLPATFQRHGSRPCI